MEDFFELGFELDLDEGVLSTEEEELFNGSYEGDRVLKLSESSLVPNEGIFIGLDISVNSSGFTVYKNGEKFKGNIDTILSENSPHRETLARRSLKADLRELIQSVGIDVVDTLVIEDVFAGENPSTVRILYALNTAIDEMVLDGELTVTNFIRVSNEEWKKWLYSVDTNSVTKGYKDKIKIQECLKMLGVEDTGVGFQDRLDSNGMILGYLITKESEGVRNATRYNKKVSFGDIVVVEGFSISDIYEEYPEVQDYDLETITIKRPTRKNVLAKLTEDPSVAYVSDSTMKLGRYAEQLGIRTYGDDGYIMFWVKPSKIKKYVGC